MEKIISKKPVRYVKNIQDCRSNRWLEDYIALEVEYRPRPDGSFQLIVKDYAVKINPDKTLSFQFLTSKDSIVFSWAEAEALGFTSKTLGEIPEHLTASTLFESNERPIYQVIENGVIYPSEWVRFSDWERDVLAFL